MSDALMVPHAKKSVERSRYRAKVAFVSPLSSRHTLHEHDACFLGVSLENHNFHLLKLHGMAEWISRRFARCTVLVGDGIHRITLEKSRSLAPAEAREEALRLGCEFVQDSEHVFDGFRDRTDFAFLKCSEIQQWPEYHFYHRQLRNYFDADLGFRASVEAFGSNYHGRRANDTQSDDDDGFGVRRSCDYFLEEFAIFCCLKRRDLSVMVYPGSFSTLAEVAGGAHPGAPAELRELTVVSLQLKGR